MVIELKLYIKGNKLIWIRQIKFFSQRDIEEQDYLLFGKICKKNILISLVESMSHMFMNKGDIIFEAGSVGEEFYIM